jgi:hypothetical protein
MEARALARLGDTRACDLALASAVTEFERRKPQDDPDWIKYFDDAELSAEFGHCLRDLGRPADAVKYASSSLAAVDEAGFVRSDFFAMMVLADSQLDAGELEIATNVAMNALTAGEMIRSARCVGYVREFGQRLSAAGDKRTMAEFDEQAAGSRLWRIASGSGRQQP